MYNLGYFQELMPLIATTPTKGIRYFRRHTHGTYVACVNYIETQPYDTLLIIDSMAIYRSVLLRFPLV